MNAKKRKITLLSITSVLTIGVMGAVLAFSAREDGLKSRATTGVSSSIVFSRDSGHFTKIDSSTASVSGVSFTGATYYAVSHNNADISDTNYVAQFGGGGSDSRYVSFSTSATGTDDFGFESITGIKVWTTSNVGQTMYVQYSSTGESFYDSEPIDASTDPVKYTFTKPHSYVRLVGSATFNRFVTKIELFYNCGGGEPEPVPEKIACYAPIKTEYELGDQFVAPEVRLIYSDKSSKVLSSGLTFSGYNLSVAGNQTVSVSYTGEEGSFATSYNITVVDPAAIPTVSYEAYNGMTGDPLSVDEYLLEGCVLPSSCAAGNTLTLVTSNVKEGYEVGWVQTSDYDDFDTQDAITWTFTMPDHDITVQLLIFEIE